MKLIDGTTKEESNNGVFNNHVFFHSDVNVSNCHTAMKEILQMEEEQIILQTKYPSLLPEIWLHIQSDGGDVFAALAMAEQLVQVSVPIYTVVEGICASAATIISIAGDRRYIQPSSLMLLHQFSGFMWGTHEEFKDRMVMHEMLLDNMISFYRKHTGMKKKRIKKILKRDSWFNAEMAIKAGLADEEIR